MLGLPIRAWRSGLLWYYKRRGLKVGVRTRFTGRVLLGSEPYLISIGNHCTVAGECIFLTHDGGTWVFRERPEYRHVIAYGRITILDNCFIGAGSIILPGVTIGPNAVVGAGSVVTKDVPANAVVVGNPARVLKSVEAYAEACLAETPDYSVEEYRRDTRAVVEKLYRSVPGPVEKAAD